MELFQKIFIKQKTERTTDNNVSETELSSLAYFDHHCHILPGMDDGAKDAKMSTAMILDMINQGCRGLTATPHYYSRESIPEFIQRRETAYNELITALKDSQEPKLSEFADHIMLGAEAAYHSNLINNNELEQLCFMNPQTGRRTEYLLLEMPFSAWNKTVMRDVSNLIYARNVVPVIAHLERYYEVTSKESIQELLNLPVIIQSNSGALTNLGSRRTALRMTKKGITQVLGTDAHNTGQRHPNMKHAVSVLKREGLINEAEEILAFNQRIFTEIEI